MNELQNNQNIASKLVQYGYTNEQRRNSFIGTLKAILTDNIALSKCDINSLINVAVKIESLGFKLGTDRAYIIPYNNKAQLQIGYKGYIELAQRSGEYKYINSTDIKEGEIGNKNRLTGEIEFNFIENEAERINKKTIGYASYLETKQGFKKYLYMSNEEIEKHLKEYSQSYNAYLRNPSNKGNIFSSSKDKMFQKTTLKLLLTRYGILDSNLREATQYDSAVIENEKPLYIDNPKSKDVEPLYLETPTDSNRDELKLIKSYISTKGDWAKRIIKAYCETIGNKNIVSFTKEEAQELIKVLETGSIDE